MMSEQTGGVIKAMQHTRKLAWVTGATSGIGRAVALKLVEDGWDIAASSRREDELLKLVTSAPQHVRSYPLDVTDLDTVKNTVQKIETEMGEISLVFLCAGTYTRDSAMSFDSKLFKQMTDVNLVGTAHCLESVMPKMIKRRRGHIAVVSSVAGYRGLPGGAFYGATKAALTNMCEALYPELESNGVRLSLVSPGFVDTPLTKKNDFPMPFIVPVEEAADAIVNGLKSKRFETVFPLKMAVAMKLLRILPNTLLFAITRRLLRKQD